MIDYKTAIEIIDQSARYLPSLKVSINNALGMVSATDIVSNEMVPPFNNSAMDGFAVRSKDIAKYPVTLVVEGSTAAGEMPAKGKVGAWEIMTGAPVPESYDTIVCIEDVDILSVNETGRPQEILIKNKVTQKQNVREAGEDFNIGDIVLNAGTIIAPEHIMALATLGIGEIEVIQKPRISIISTGKELVDDISQQLAPGQIRNSNASYLLSALTSCGIDSKYRGTIHDEIDAFEETIAELLNSNNNIIISTGAVSMGRYDFIPDSLRKLGATILFHKVAIRPGKPILFAKFPNGIFYFGLPGNPVSAAVGLRFFVMPLIRKLQMFAIEKPVFARITNQERKKQGFRFFRKAYAYTDANGQIKVDILDGQESFKIHPMLKANCWAVLPENVDYFAAEEIIQIYPLALSVSGIFSYEEPEIKIQKLLIAG